MRSKDCQRLLSILLDKKNIEKHFDDGLCTYFLNLKYSNLIASQDYNFLMLKLNEAWTIRKTFCNDDYYWPPYVWWWRKRWIKKTIRY